MMLSGHVMEVEAFVTLDGTFFSNRYPVEWEGCKFCIGCNNFNLP